MMRFVRNITLMAAMILAAAGCEKINQPSSNFLKFHVDVENMGVGTKAAGSGPSEFYMLGWYWEQYNPYFYDNNEIKFKKYSLRENGDYVIENKTSVTDNPLWATNKLSSFWAFTTWGRSYLPNLTKMESWSICNLETFDTWLTYYGEQHVGCEPQQIDILDASNQSDFIVAFSSKNQGATVEDDILHLHFYHTLSKVNFVDNTNGMIKSLEVDNTYNFGALVFSKDGECTWSDSKDIHYTKTMNGVNESMYLIPQTFTSDIPFKVTIVLQDGSRKTQTLDNVAWQAGYEYTYGLNLASNGDANSGVATKSSNAGDSDFFIECISEKKY